MVGVILYLFSWEWAAATRKVAPGGAFARTVMECCYWFLTLLGGIHFSTAIIEEVEEQTLPLLKMTGASSFTILIGKSLPRLGVALLFLCCATPFLVLALTLGGVLPLGLASAVLGTLCYAVMLSQLGLLSSVLCRNAKQAFLLTSIGWAAIELCHWWYELAYAIFQHLLKDTTAGAIGVGILTGLLSWIPDCSLWNHLSDDLLSFSTATSSIDESWVDWFLRVTAGAVQFHMAAQLVLALIFFLLSWLLFEPLTSRAASRGDGSQTVQKKIETSVRRATWNPVAWKSFVITAGGKRWLWIRLLGVPIIVLGLVIGIGALNNRADLTEVAGFAMILGIPFAIINASRLLGGVFTEEIQGKTLPSLMMLPQSTAITAASMVGGLLPSILAGSFCFVAGLILMIAKEGFVDFDEILLEPFFWHFVSLLLLTLHIGVLLTTHLRYGGMVLAFVLGFMTSCCAVPIVGEVMVTSNEVQRFFVVGIVILLELFFCVLIQRTIVRRLEEIAAK